MISVFDSIFNQSAYSLHEAEGTTARLVVIKTVLLGIVLWHNLQSDLYKINVKGSVNNIYSVTLLSKNRKIDLKVRV